MEVFAKRLKWLREKKHLGQKELASEIGITLSAVQKLEYNERDPKLDRLIGIARFFEVSTDFLLGLSDDVPELKGLVTTIYAYQTQIENRSEDLRILYKEISLLEREENKSVEIDALWKKYNSHQRLLLTMQEKLTNAVDQYTKIKAGIPYPNLKDDKIFLKVKPKGILLVDLKETFKVVLIVNDNEEIVLGTFNEKSKAEAYMNHYKNHFGDILENNLIQYLNEEQDEMVKNIRSVGIEEYLSEQGIELK